MTKLSLPYFLLVFGAPVPFRLRVFTKVCVMSGIRTVLISAMACLPQKVQKQVEKDFEKKGDGIALKW